MKNTRLILCLSFLSFGILKAQIVNIPDPNFKAYLVNNPEINTNHDDEIQLSEAESFSGMIDCPDLEITDLTGIEAFVNIPNLNCYKNEISALDLSQNIALEFLDCSFNEILVLDLSKNTALKVLYCSLNKLSALDLSQNTALEFLDCSFNKISTLDLGHNTALENLVFGFNKIAALDLSHNTALELLTCVANNLSSLDVSQNIALKALVCEGNSLTSLDLSQNAALVFLSCYNNEISALDVSQNTALKVLQCTENELKSLNLKNGNNINLKEFLVSNNPDLRCIEVDDVDLAYSMTRWSKDDTAEYSTDCLSSSTTEFSLKETYFYPNPVEDILYFEEPMSDIRMMDYSGRMIQQYEHATDRIYLASLANGVYFVVGRTTSGEYIGGKVVKVGR
ncbi:MAG TPA: T9SS type A sorting domain-containing protein [Saprospiraceae bacterium]|nr:T9SS type A sorting domain-containing protein [Saprospiraceae bacterium]